MPEEQRQIFREQSLEKLSSPDRLDEMLRIVNPPAWIVLGTIGVGMLLVLLWSVIGHIPASVNGTAILVHPKRVIGFQARSSGPIAEVLVDVGQKVEANDLLARLDLPHIRNLLEQENAKLLQFQTRSGQMTELEKGLAEEEMKYLDQQRKSLIDRAEKLEQAAEKALGSDVSYIEKQGKNVMDARRLLTELLEKLKEQNEKSAELAEEGLVRKSDAIEAQRQQIESELRLAELGVKESELELRKIISEESYHSQMDLARDLRIQAGALRLRELEIARRTKADEIVNSTEIDEINARIDQLKGQLKDEGEVRAEKSGTVIEVTVVRGQHVAIGQRLGNLEIEDESSLQALAYFPIKAGKKLALEMPIRVSPTTVERERFGAIRGTVRFVSSYPITTEAAGNQIGNVDVARRLLGGESRIEVIADLDEDDSPTGFAWTSGEGPPKKVAITPGTTASVRVTVDEVRPIELLLPFLKSLSGS